MALPKIDVPIYELELPSTGQKIKYRPFLVKEEKVLLMAAESDDARDRVLAIRQILNNCCLTEGVDIDELASFDLEYYFIQLRARSAGETLDMVYTCQSEKCEGTTPFEINLTDIKVIKSEEVNNKIKLSDKIGVVLKYPKLDTISELVNITDDVDTTIKMISECIDYIYDDEEIYNRKDTEEEELIQWVEGLSQEHFQAIEAFFERMPKIKYTTTIACNKCNEKQEIEIEGLQSFFG